jgi:hypothetical protein
MPDTLPDIIQIITDNGYVMNDRNLRSYLFKSVYI